MGLPDDRKPLPDWLEKHSRSIAGSALLAATVGFALPGPTGAIAAASAVLALAAMAVFAGHAWAMVVVAVADIALAGLLVASLRAPLSGAGSLIAGIGLAFALPG